MKIKSGVLLLAIIFALTGCIDTQTKHQPDPVAENPKVSVEIESNITLEEVTNALKSEGIEMFDDSQQNDWILNKVKSNRFSVSRPNVIEKYKEYISIYVYNSENARSEGLADFNKQKELYDMMIPNIYEHKNVLILYWHHEDMNNATNAKFNKQIEMAIQKM